jgi:uncharacterized membrane protein YqjE
LRRLLGTALDLLHTRLALAATELEEERARLGAQFVAAALALFCAGVALVLFALWVVWIADPAQRALVLGALAAAFGAVAALALLHWRRLARSKPPLLSATLEELRKDQAALTGRPR